MIESSRSSSSRSSSGIMRQDGPSPNYLRLPLREFLECFPPPQTGRMVDGYYPDVDDEMFNIRPGTVLNFHRQVSPNVPLSFNDPWGGVMGNQRVKVTLPIEFQGRFQLLPYDPDSGDHSPDHIYRSVEDLVRAFPVYVQANSSYHYDPDPKDIEDDPGEWSPQMPETSFQCGDRLKLIRLVHKYGQKVIECRLLGESRLILLPMDCVGNFTVVPDDNEYMLTDLLSMLPRQRRLHITDTTHKQHKIPGLPANFHGDLYLEEPESFVEASPMEDPGLIIGLPNTLDVHVAPEENSFDKGQLLNTFATNNRNLFPVVARVTDWDEETTILENHFVKPGVELVIHGWTRQSKVLALAGDQYYAIPLTYQGRFRIKPQQFHGASDLENAHPAYKIRVVDTDPSDMNTSISPGDVLRLIRGDSLHRNAKASDKGQYLKCEKLEGIGRGREIKIPIQSQARFEEVIEDMKADDYAIKELVTFVSDSELVVDLIQGSLDQKIDDRDLPLNGLPITLCDFIVEPAVYVSVETADSPAFHIPLRTLIYIAFVQQLEKASSPLLTRQNPKLSTLDRCVEVLPTDVAAALQPPGRTAFSSMPSELSSKATQQWNSVQGNRSLSASREAGSPPSVSSYEVEDRSVNQIRHIQSFAHSDYGGKPRGIKAKLKNKFRRHKSTESLPQEFSIANGSHSPRANNTDYLARYDSVDVSAPAAPMVIHPTPRLLSNGHGARSGPSSVVSSVRSMPRHAVQPHRQQPVPMPAQGIMINGGQQFAPMMQPGGGYMMVPVQQPGMGGGYMMMPSIQQPMQNMSGYMMVPIMPQQQQIMQTSNLVHRHQSHKSSNSSSSADEDDLESASTVENYTDVNFNRSKQFKVVIPGDGNLYHFSVQKMGDLFRQLKIDEGSVRACLKDKIDGKKFSKMSEAQLDKYGLMHPVVVHFRRLTVKKTPNFML